MVVDAMKIAESWFRVSLCEEGDGNEGNRKKRERENFLPQPKEYVKAGTEFPSCSTVTTRLIGIDETSCFVLNRVKLVCLFSRFLIVWTIRKMYNLIIPVAISFQNFYLRELAMICMLLPGTGWRPTIAKNFDHHLSSAHTWDLLIVVLST